MKKTAAGLMLILMALSTQALATHPFEICFVQKDFKVVILDPNNDKRFFSVVVNITYQFKSNNGGDEQLETGSVVLEKRRVDNSWVAQALLNEKIHSDLYSRSLKAVVFQYLLFDGSQTIELFNETVVPENGHTLKVAPAVVCRNLAN